jgi:hypothetical protein
MVVHGCQLLSRIGGKCSISLHMCKVGASAATSYRRTMQIGYNKLQVIIDDVIASSKLADSLFSEGLLAMTYMGEVHPRPQLITQTP